MAQSFSISYQSNETESNACLPNKPLQSKVYYKCITKEKWLQQI
jgi:hypothetical protein